MTNALETDWFGSAYSKRSDDPALVDQLLEEVFPLETDPTVAWFLDSWVGRQSDDNPNRAATSVWNLARLAYARPQRAAPSLLLDEFSERQKALRKWLGARQSDVASNVPSLQSRVLSRMTLIDAHFSLAKASLALTTVEMAQNFRSYLADALWQFAMSWGGGQVGLINSTDAGVPQRFLPSEVVNPTPDNLHAWRMQQIRDAFTQFDTRLWERKLEGEATGRVRFLSAMAMVERGLNWILELDQAGRAKKLTVPLVGEVGSAAHLIVQVFALSYRDGRGLPPLLVPDPVRTGVTGFDSVWQRHFQAAAELVGVPASKGQHGYFFGVEFTYGNRPFGQALNWSSTEKEALRRPAALRGSSASLGAACLLWALREKIEVPEDQFVTGAIPVPGPQHDEPHLISGTIVKLLTQFRVDVRRPPICGCFAPDEALGLQLVERLSDLHPVRVKEPIEAFKYLRDVAATNGELLQQVLSFLEQLATTGLARNMLVRPFGNQGIGQSEAACIEPLVITEQEWKDLQTRRARPQDGKSPASSGYVTGITEEELRDLNRQSWPQQQQHEQPRPPKPRAIFEHLRDASGFYILRGEPGEGKTVALWLHVTRLAKALYNHLQQNPFDLESDSLRVPFVLPLREVGSKGKRPLLKCSIEYMLDLIVPKAERTKARRAALRNWLERRAENYRVWLCLDAHDEMTASPNWLVRNLIADKLIERVPVLLTARYSENASIQQLVGERRAELRLVCFDLQRQRQFVQMFFAGSATGQIHAQRLIAALRQSPGPQALGRIPLLLGLLCEVQANLSVEEQLPHTKTEVLKAGLYGMLKSSSRKAYGVQHPWSELAEADRYRLRVLRYVAWWAYTTLPQVITQELFNEIIEKCPPEVQRWVAIRSVDDLFRSFRDDGVLVPQAGGYRFVLRSFHEFCLAAWIAHESPAAQSNNEAAFRQMVQGRADDWNRPDWLSIKPAGSDLPFKPLNQSGWWNVWPLVAGQLLDRARWLMDVIRDPSQEDILLSRARLAATLCPELKLSEPDLESIAAPLVALLRTKTRDDVERVCGLRTDERGARVAHAEDKKLVWPGYGALRKACAQALGDVPCRGAVDALGDSVGRDETEVHPVFHNRPFSHGKTEANALVHIGTEMATQRLITAIRSNKGEHCQLGCVRALEYCTSGAPDDILKEILFDTLQFLPDPTDDLRDGAELACAAISTLIARGVTLTVHEAWRALPCLFNMGFFPRELARLIEIVPKEVGRYVPVLDKIAGLRRQVRLGVPGSASDLLEGLSEILAEDSQHGLIGDLLRQEEFSINLRDTLLMLLIRVERANDQALAAAMSLLSNRSASNSLRFTSAGLLLLVGDQTMRGIAKRFLTAIVRDLKSATESITDVSLNWLSRQGGEDIDELLFSLFTDSERSPAVQNLAGRYLARSTRATELLGSVLTDPSRSRLLRKRAAWLIPRGSMGTTILKSVFDDPQSEIWLKKLCLRALASGGSSVRQVVMDIVANKGDAASLTWRIWCTKLIGFRDADENPFFVPAEIDCLMKVAETAAEHRKLRETCLKQIRCSLAAGNEDDQAYQKTLSLRTRHLFRASRHETRMRIECAMILAALGDQKIGRFLAQVVQSPKVPVSLRRLCAEYLADSELELADLHWDLLVRLLTSRVEDLSIRLAIADGLRKWVDSSEIEAVFDQLRRDSSTPENLRAKCVVDRYYPPALVPDSSQSTIKSLREQLSQTKWRNRMESTRLSETPFVEIVCDQTLSVHVRLRVLLSLCKVLPRGRSKNSKASFNPLGAPYELNEEDCRRFQQLVANSGVNAVLRWGVAAVLNQVDNSPDSNGIAALRAAVSTCLTDSSLPDFVSYFLGQKLHEWSITGWRFLPATLSWDAP